MLLGAYILLMYLRWAYPALRQELKPLQDGLLFGLIISTFALPGNRKREASNPSPAWSGVAVVVATGTAAAFALGPKTDPAGAVAALVVTAALAVGVWRFAKLNAQNIGEARFDTTSKPR